MNEAPAAQPTRGQIALRLFFTLLFIPIYGIANAIIVLTTLFQFASLLITMKHSEPVRLFANKVVTFAYKVWRYVSLNDNLKPFPFREFPAEMEPPAEQVLFD